MSINGEMTYNGNHKESSSTISKDPKLLPPPVSTPEMKTDQELSMLTNIRTIFRPSCLKFSEDLQEPEENWNMCDIVQ